VWACTSAVVGKKKKGGKSGMAHYWNTLIHGRMTKTNRKKRERRQ